MCGQSLLYQHCMQRAFRALPIFLFVDSFHTFQRPFTPCKCVSLNSSTELSVSEVAKYIIQIQKLWYFVVNLLYDSPPECHHIAGLVLAE